MQIRLEVRPFRFKLRRPLRTATNILSERCGWLLRLEDTFGRCGWGEVSPLDPSRLPACASILAELGTHPLRAELDDAITYCCFQNKKNIFCTFCRHESHLFFVLLLV